MNQAKVYLNQLRILDSKIQRRQQEVDELKQAAMSLGSVGLDPDKVRTDSPDPDPLASRIVNYVKMENEINEMIDEFIDLKHTIIGQIQMLEDANCMDVLWKRYVDRKTFVQIAEEMHYDISTIFRIHGRALQMFNEKFIFVNVQ